MNRKACFGALALLALASTVLAQHGDSTPEPTAPPPPLYTNLGSWSHKITTTSPQAQRFFDQGLRLTFAFNHEEAARAYREAARLDPGCAMAWWGVALVAGPNINLPMDEDHRLIANEAIARAQELRQRVGESERGYIAALTTRYSTDPKASRAGLDSAYANAMSAHAKRWPKDADAQVLAAESLLDLAPWNQWTLDGKANPGTEAIVARLESALERWPNHPGACHYYIHAIEASPHPDKALAACKRLETLMPGAGHLVHMPSHIYARTSSWSTALELNERAALVDEKFIAEQKPKGIYPYMYYSHNLHFIWFTASMQAQSAKALEGARRLAKNIPYSVAEQMPMMQHWPPVPIVTLAHFGRWDEVLKEAAPPASLRYTTAIWNYARGQAFAAKGDFTAAQAALDTIEAIVATTPADFYISTNPGASLLQIAADCLAGTIAMRQKRNDEAVSRLQKAVAIEDGLHYDEPPTWYYPVRHDLGAALLAAGKPKEAEAVYREDQRRHPQNGWSLLGLSQALRAQGLDAATAEASLKTVWAQADVKPPGSVF